MKYQYILLLCALATPVWSNSAGAPKEACVDLVPQHGLSPQNSPAPYTILVSKDNVKSGETVQITLKGNSNKDLIKGFLSQVRIGNQPVGTFVPGPNTQTLDCSASKDSITHKKMSGDGVREISFTWSPPSGFNGKVNVVATVALQGDIFWVGKVSKSLTVA